MCIYDLLNWTHNKAGEAKAAFSLEKLVSMISQKICFFKNYYVIKYFWLDGLHSLNYNVWNEKSVSILFFYSSS